MEKKQYELEEHQLLHVWDAEARLMNRHGYDLQRQALALLQETASEQRAEKCLDKELRTLEASVTQERDEAVALGAAHANAEQSLANTWKDLRGLEQVHDAVHAELRQALHLINLSENKRVAASACSLGDCSSAKQPICSFVLVLTVGGA